MEHHPDVVLAVSPAAVEALRPVAASTPIVFLFIPDPVALRLTTSFAHPSGGMTGFTQAPPSIASKELQLLKQIDPAMSEAGLLLDPRNAALNSYFLPVLDECSKSLDITLTQLSVAGDAEISEVIADFARLPKRAIFVVPSAYFIIHRDTIIAAAQHASVPAAYWDRLFTDTGGLLSYGIDDADVFRFAAG
jgi:putative tryptophan/tyrosine transport system substrate-binding protein